MILALPFLAPALQAAAAPHPRQAEARELMAAVQGTWSCRGAFADGRALAADLRFERVFDGLGMRYVHVDRAPNSYRQDSHWVFDRESGHIVSLALTGFGKPIEANAALYVGEEWTANSVTLVHRRLLADPFAVNRFRYSVADGRLKMVWEVSRVAGQWKMGDYLDCGRAKGEGAR